MSIERCKHCNNQIDTDEDLDCYDEEGQAFCEPCRDRRTERELYMAHPEPPDDITSYRKAKGEKVYE